MNLQVIAVEYNNEMDCYMAIFDDGDNVPLESTTLSEAWAEAERIVEYG